MCVVVLIMIFGETEADDSLIGYLYSVIARFIKWQYL